MTTDTTSNPSRRRRAVCFQHIRTGRIIAAPSVTAFARKARLGPLGKYHYDNVLKGHRLHVRGWGLPERLNQHLDVQDRWGNRWSGSVNDLRCHLGPATVNQLARGEPTARIAPVGKEPKDGPGRLTLRYTGYAVRKGGKIHRGRTLREVAAKVGCSVGPIWSLVHGKQAKTRDGIVLHRATAVRRSALPCAKSCSA